MNRHRLVALALVVVALVAVWALARLAGAPPALALPLVSLCAGVAVRLLAEAAGVEGWAAGVCSWLRERFGGAP